MHQFFSWCESVMDATFKECAGGERMAKLKTQAENENCDEHNFVVCLFLKMESVKELGEMDKEMNLLKNEVFMLKEV